MKHNKGKISFEGARIIFRNFRGEKRRYNDEGDRNFNIVVDEADAEWLRDFGLRLKPLRNTREDEDPEYSLKVNVKFDSNRPPRVILVTSRNKTVLNEETVGELDYMEIENIDLTINMYRREETVTAYLHSMYVTPIEDEFESKYADLPDGDD